VVEPRFIPVKITPVKGAIEALEATLWIMKNQPKVETAIKGLGPQSAEWLVAMMPAHVQEQIRRHLLHTVVRMFDLAARGNVARFAQLCLLIRQDKKELNSIVEHHSVEGRGSW
jgi:hypothetical protein